MGVESGCSLGFEGERLGLEEQRVHKYVTRGVWRKGKTRSGSTFRREDTGNDITYMLVEEALLRDFSYLYSLAHMLLNSTVWVHLFFPRSS